MTFPVRIIPCLDVTAGRVVKGVNFVDLVDAGDPVEQARAYDAQGADELCFLDITASSDDRGIMHDMVDRVAQHCFMSFTVGGGVRALAEPVVQALRAAGQEVAVFDAVQADPPPAVVEAALALARRYRADAVIGLRRRSRSDRGVPGPPRPGVSAPRARPGGPPRPRSTAGTTFEVRGLSSVGEIDHLRPGNATIDDNAISRALAPLRRNARLKNASRRLRRPGPLAPNL